MRPSPADLRDLFVKKRWSPEQIADHYHCSRTTVYRWLRDLDIRRERDSWALTVSADELRALYGEPLSVEQIAKRKQTTPSKVYRAMKRHHIPRRRPTSQTNPRPKAKTPPPADELRQVLQDKGSVKRVADHYRVGVSTAYHWLSAANIEPLRPPGQRRSTAKASAGAAFGPGADGGSDPARTISASRPVG
jgi:transposase